MALVHGGAASEPGALSLGASDLVRVGPDDLSEVTVALPSRAGGVDHVGGRRLAIVFVGPVANLRVVPAIGDGPLDLAPRTANLKVLAIASTVVVPGFCLA